MTDQTADQNESIEPVEVKQVSPFNLEDLKKFGGIVDRKPVRKTIEWTSQSGEKLVADIFIRKQSFENFSQFLDKDYTAKNKVGLAALIAKSLASDETGKKDLLTYDQACSLEYGLALVFISAINEVNGATKKN